MIDDKSLARAKEHGAVAVRNISLSFGFFATRAGQHELQHRHIRRRFTRLRMSAPIPLCQQNLDRVIPPHRPPIQSISKNGAGATVHD
jgi:hypothetical protein